MTAWTAAQTLGVAFARLGHYIRIRSMSDAGILQPPVRSAS